VVVTGRGTEQATFQSFGIKSPFEGQSQHLFLFLKIAF
jgi:hypothetical protein